MQSASFYLSERSTSRTIDVVASDTVKPAFAEVYKTHKHAIYTYVLFRVGQNKEVTEDVVSDIFLKAYKNFDRYDERYAITTWLYTIARNTLTDYYRKQRTVVDIDDELVADEMDPLFRLCTEEISVTEVELAVQNLPDLQRICVSQQFWGGKTAKEIALEQNLTHAAVRKQVSRGVAALRTALLKVVCVVTPVINLFV